MALRRRYDVPSEVQQALGLWVRATGAQTTRADQRSRNRQIGAYALVYVHRGTGWFESDVSERREVPEGTVLRIFPEPRYSYGPERGSWEEYWVQFGGPLADGFRLHGYLAEDRPLVRVGADSQLVATFERLLQAFLPGGPLAVPLASAIVHELVMMVHGIDTGLLGDPDSEKDVVVKALRLIEREADSGMDPPGLADRLGVGYSTLRRLFRSRTGSSVKEYILNVQLAHAKELLARTSLAVHEVAGRVGFSDPYYFSRLFRRREGVPPAVFRARERRGA